MLRSVFAFLSLSAIVVSVCRGQNLEMDHIVIVVSASALASRVSGKLAAPRGLRSYPVSTQTFHYQRLAEFDRMDVLGTVWVESKADGHVDPELEAVFCARVQFVGDLPAPSARMMVRHAGLLREAARLAISNH